MVIAFILGALLGAAPAPSPIVAACAGRPTGPGPAAAAVRVTGANDFPFLDIVSPKRGTIGRAYFEPALGNVARDRLPCLAAMLDALHDDYAGDRPVRWAPVVFTSDPSYRAPVTSEDVRWPILLPKGEWTDATERFFFETLPHEQVHARQKLLAKRLPRWFEEGHAEWSGLRITRLVRPKLESARRAELESAARTQSVGLAAWGGMKVKREAIERQLSPEERKRRQIDPTYVPKGPFRFGPGDLEPDNESTPARYGRALAVFERLEERHGAAAVNQWIFTTLSSLPDRSVEASAAEVLGEDLKPLIE